VEAVWLPLYQFDVAVGEPADADDAVPVANVAVVEDEAARGGVVADVVDVGSSPAGTPSMVRGRGSSATSSTRLKSWKVRVRGSWSVRSWAVGLSASWAISSGRQWLMRTVGTFGSSVIG
jgi:hypothetical protein